MNGLVVHPVTEARLQNIRKDLPQSLLLTGEPGVGLKTIAKALADSNLTILLEPRDKKENIDSENGTITVEMIRRLYEQTRAKQTRAQVIIIDGTDRMSRGASNAFLKLLEEPTSHFHFILTSHSPQLLLPTIRSRVQQLAIRPITNDQTAKYLVKLGVADPTKIRQLQFIAGGLPAELYRLANDEAHFKARAALMADARDFLQGDAYQKILIAQKYQSDRPGALRLIDSALVISRRSISAKPQPSLIRQLDKLLRIRENIAANYNARLQLSQFVL